MCYPVKESLFFKNKHKHFQETFFKKVSCLCLVFGQEVCYAPSMKQILGTIYQKLIITLLLFCSLVASCSHAAAATSPSSTPAPSTSPPVTSVASAQSDDPSSHLVIRAINPGYLINGRHNVGELIVLQNLSDVSISLAGFSLRYTNGEGNSHTLFTFVDGTLIAGKNLLLRYYTSPEHDLAHIVYSGTLAMTAGPLQLMYNDAVVDEVCWTGRNGCLPAFNKDSPTTIVRNSNGELLHLPVAEVDLDYDPDAFVVASDSTNPPSPDEPEVLPPQCRGLEFSELLTYYDQDKSEQFIEFHNSSSSDVSLDGCMLSYKNKSYPLTGQVPSQGYYAYPISAQIALTKNPKNPLALAIIDADGSVVDEITYPNGQKKSTSYARIFDSSGAVSWQITYLPTPGSENIYQQYRTCEAGKIINKATGNCVKVTTIKSSTSSSTDDTPAPCPAGKYRNPLTGRCKNIASTSTTLKPCAEGYERNPETNRCRKVASTSQNDGADYALVPTTHSDQTVFIGAGIVLLIVLLGVTYIVLQFRHEIARAVRKVSQRFNSIRQDLLAGKISLHRHKKP